MAAVLYAVPIANAERLLGNTGLKPVQLGGFGVVNVAWFDYGETSIGAYHELSFGILASTEELGAKNLSSLLLGKAGPIGAYVVALPVDSELARAGGVDRYGLPKTLVDMKFEWSPRQLKATVFDRAQPVLSMQIPLGLGPPVWIRELVIYSRLQGQLLATRIATSWLAQIDWVSRPRYTDLERQHPLATIVHELDLEACRAIAVVHGRLNYAELPPPRRSP